jgi:hypothetical protein
METENLAHQISHARVSTLETKLTILIAALAVVLAIAEIGAQTSDNHAREHQLAATNLYAFFQAKNIRQNQYKLLKEELEIVSPFFVYNKNLTKNIEEKIAEIDKKILAYESNADTHEGKKELLFRAKSEEEKHQLYTKKETWFHVAVVLLQLSIIFCSLAILLKRRWIIKLSITLGLSGFLATLNGFLIIF